jgi:hypothetical protein
LIFWHVYNGLIRLVVIYCVLRRHNNTLCKDLPCRFVQG